MPESMQANVASEHPSQVAEGVFLSPRVLDRGAFEEYTARLRALLEQVAAQGLALRSASADADRLVTALRAQFTDRSEALESATRLAQSMNQRLDEVRGILGKAGDLAGLAAEFDARTQRIVDEKLAAVERRFAEIIERFGKSTQDRVQQAAAQAAAAAEQARAEREETRRLIESIARPATEALAAQVRRAETLASPGAGGLAAMAQLAEHLGGISAKAEQNLTALQSVNETATTAVRCLQDVLAGQDLGAAVASSEQARGEIRRIAAECRDLAGPLHDAEARAAHAADRAEHLLARVDEAREGGRQVVLELGQTMNGLYDALDALEPWRSVLLEGREDGLPAPLAEIVKGVRAEMSQDLAVIAAAMTQVAKRAAGDKPAPAPVEREPEVVVRVTEPGLRLAES